MPLLNRMLISCKTPQVGYHNSLSFTNAWYGMSATYSHTAYMDQDELFLLTKDEDSFRFFVEGIVQQLKDNSINLLIDPSLPEEYRQSMAICKTKLMKSSGELSAEGCALSVMQRIEKEKTASERLTSTLMDLGSLPGERPLYGIGLTVVLSVSRDKDSQTAVGIYHHTPYYSQED